jgi:hypothetical protein
MGSLDNVYDTIQKLEDYGIEYLLITVEKGKKKALKESVDIANFIYALSTKNYAQANKYLVQAVESKISNRIDQAINTPLF